MTPEEQWITKEEAGARLGSPERPLSTRRVLELAKTGRLQSDQARDPETGHMAVRIHAGSVERFIFERDNRSDQLRSAQISSDNRSELSGHLTTRGSRGPLDTRDLIEFITRIVRPALCAPSARLWLTVTESAAYSGLPVTILQGFIREGKLNAMDVGRRRRGGRWRIRRSDLEAFGL